MSIIGQVPEMGIKRTYYDTFESEETNQRDKRLNKDYNDSEGYWGLFSDEIFLSIFKHLPPRDQESASCVCRSWHRIAEDKSLKELREFLFGKAKWAKYCGDIGVEPPLPSNINQILKSPCPFWDGKKVEQTHLLVLVPQTINGESFTLNTLEKLIQAPRGGGHATKYAYYYDRVKDNLGNRSSPSHWVLMTRDVIPDSRSKSYDDQEALVQRHAQTSGQPYELPHTLDATTCILMHYIDTGEALYKDDKLGTQYTHTLTRCQEKVNDNQRSVGIGSFSSGGLSIYDLHCDWRHDDYGAACGRVVE